MKIRKSAAHTFDEPWQLIARVVVSRLVAAMTLLVFSAGVAQAQNQQLVPVLQGLLNKYKGCILERYETQQDMRNRGLNGNLSGLSSINGLHDRDVVTCVAGNQCSRASRQTMYSVLQAQANRGDPTVSEAPGVAHQACALHDGLRRKQRHNKGAVL